MLYYITNYKMGIPSYFSYIIKNYTNIIRKFKDCERFQHLFMDCNSIVYDAYNTLDKQVKAGKISLAEIESRGGIEEEILKNVIENIQNYILFISPEKSVFITFDGVAPFPKMEQQRIRRYKSSFMAKLLVDKNGNQIQPLWNTTAITPGTEFMEKLTDKIHLYFDNTEKKFGIEKMMISCSDECGEGEHKIFEYVRANDISMDNIAVYGLDSDLIMLSIFHLEYCKQIYVFRETPEFKSVISVNSIKDPTEKLFMDISLLTKQIACEMGSPEKGISRVYDYLFVCFFLGNDFLPHIPAFNIRTNGTQILMDVYKKTIGNYKDRSLVSPITKKMDMANVNIFMSELAEIELECLLREYSLRDKFEKRVWSENTDEEKEELLLNVPMIARREEKYICPGEKGWEKRYNKGADKPGEYIKMLAWVLEYYVRGVKDKRKEEVKVLGLLKWELGREEEREEESDWYTKRLQLSYVLGLEEMKKYLRKEEVEYLLKEEKENYPEKYEMNWKNARYFWEAKPKLPKIRREELEKREKELEKINKKKEFENKK